jgi:hypothetical protein
VAWKYISKPWKYILVPLKYISKPLKLFCCERQRNLQPAEKEFMKTGREVHEERQRSLQPTEMKFMKTG